MSLYLKVFLWFWLATALVIGALAFASYATRGERAMQPPQFVVGIMSAYARHAVETFEREGPAALDAFLGRLEQEANVRGRLFDAGGAELAGRAATEEEQELAARAARAGSTVSRMSGGRVIDAFPWPGRGGRGFVFVATMSLRPSAPDGQAPPARRPFPPPGPFGFLLGESTAALAARLVAALLTAGVLCYGLARYIVSPVVKLRAVTRQVAGGDLSARVGPLLGGRSDELGAMGRDFDAMAARIEALLSAQTRLLRDISHELRSPLARLSVALDLARKRAGPEAAGQLARIEREAGRLNEMIGQLLTLSRWEAGAGGSRRESVDLAALVREVAEDADFEARGQNRAVELVACDACATAGTPALLRSAFENVVRNAVRHTPEGTAVRISLRCARDGEEDDGDGAGRAVVTVRDEGAGVPAEALTEIFRPFYRVDDARDRESGGTGLGLAITERAVRLHGGTVTAENVAGGGFVVEIRLPLDAHLLHTP